MSIIGLLDWDLLKWREPTCFNLELMKLSTYYKNYSHDIVIMANDFDLSRYSKIFIQKDYEDLLYPEEIIKDSRVNWGGLAINNDNYISMLSEIEECVPDTDIYIKMQKFYQKDKVNQKLFNIMLKAHHLRLSLDNKNIFNNWKKQIENDNRNKYFIFHDKNIQNIPQYFDVLEEIRNQYCNKNYSFGFKFPIYLKDINLLDKIAKFNKIYNMSNLYISQILPNNKLSLFSSFPNQKISYFFSEKQYNFLEITELLPTIFLQGIYLASNGITLSINFENTFKIDKNYSTLIKIFNSYFSEIEKYRFKLMFCFFSYCKYCCFQLQKEEKIDLFNFVKQNNLQLFDLFYNAEYVILKDKMLIPRMYNKNEIKNLGGYGGIYYKNLTLNTKPIEYYIYNNEIKREE